MADLATSRRALLGALTLAPIALTAAVAPVVHPDQEPWRRAVATYKDACAKHDAAVRVHGDAESRYFAAREKEPAAPEPPAFDNSMPLAAIVAQSRSPEWRQTWAAYEQTVADCRARNKALHDRLVIRAEQASNKALKERTEAAWLIAATPAPTIGHVAQKVELLTSEFGELDSEYLACALADMRRLAAATRS